MTGEIEKLLGELERTATPATLDRVRALTAALLHAHAAGLGRVMEVLAARGEAGEAIARDLVKDRVVEALLLLHGVHPLAVGERVRAAIEGVAPALRAQGAVAVVLAATSEGIAVRIDAVPGGAPRGTGARTIVEQALLDAAPDVAVVDIAIAFDDAATFVPVSRVGGRR